MEQEAREHALTAGEKEDDKEEDIPGGDEVHSVCRWWY